MTQRRTLERAKQDQGKLLPQEHATPSHQRRRCDQRAFKAFLNNNIPVPGCILDCSECHDTEATPTQVRSVEEHAGIANVVPIQGMQWRRLEACRSRSPSQMLMFFSKISYDTVHD